MRRDKAATAVYMKAYRLRPEALERERERLRQRQADPAHRERERERHRADRQRPEVKAQQRDYQRRYAKTKADVTRAHTAVKYALKTGRLSRPATCERCPATTRLHAHHDHYGLPLVVRWLCPLCHKAVHQENANG